MALASWQGLLGCVTTWQKSEKETSCMQKVYMYV
jgi:hypothetical protein